MARVSNGVARTRSRSQIWGVSAAVLFPVLVLIWLAASAATSIERPADDVKTEAGR
jgi:hypothetical protein